MEKRCYKVKELQEMLGISRAAVRGLHFEPTLHEGYVARKVERLGGISERCECNRKIRRKNDRLRAIREQLSSVQKALNKLRAARKQMLSELLRLLDVHLEGPEISR